MSDRIEIIHADNRQALHDLARRRVFVDAVVTDPPYGLSFMGKRWDYDVPDVETWRAIGRVLKPGGHVLAFFAPRTYHRGAVAIEDAGFEIRDLVAWLFGSGFPKSLDVAKAIDAKLGAVREVVGTKEVTRDFRDISGGRYGDPAADSAGRTIAVTAAASADAKLWEGWGTALKPALEPVCLARKPFAGTVADAVLANGTGALNIDACRVPAEERPAFVYHETGSKRGYDGGIKGGAQIGTKTEGRWPANVVHDGSDEVVQGFPAEGGGGTRKAFRVTFGLGGKGAYNGGGKGAVVANYADAGSAARFFYSAKADEAERAGSEHPTIKPVDLMAWLCRLVTPPGGLILDPFAGTGTTGAAALREGFRCILIEREAQYVADIRRRIDRLAGADTPLLARAGGQAAARTIAPPDVGPPPPGFDPLVPIENLDAHFLEAARQQAAAADRAAAQSKAPAAREEPPAPRPPVQGKLL